MPAINIKMDKVMTKKEKIANIVAFFAIMFGEDSPALDAFMKLAPDYIIEKFERYVLSPRVEHPWGLHPSLRKNIFDVYIDKWEWELEENE